MPTSRKNNNAGIPNFVVLLAISPTKRRIEPIRIILSIVSLITDVLLFMVPRLIARRFPDQVIFLNKRQANKVKSLMAIDRWTVE
jgi:hypothetical protein